MIGLLLGGLVLLALLGGLRAFERASVGTIKALLAWIAALGGLTLALLLILTGRGPLAFLALSMLYPLVRDQWRLRRPGGGAAAGLGAGAGAVPPPPRSAGPMTRGEAYEVLGLEPGAREADIQAAYVRLMRAAHPDRGGSDWLATRINQARDVLLGRARQRSS